MKQKLALGLLLLSALCLVACGQSTTAKEESTTISTITAIPLETTDTADADTGQTTKNAATSEDAGETATTDNETTIADDAQATDTTEDSAATETATEEANTGTLLYIGTASSGFETYELTLEGDLTAEALIAGIESLTGWDLTLSDEVTMGKGGATVCFAGTGSLFVGAPASQVEAFFVYDQYQLAETILDSVKKTIQMAFTGELGDPDALDVYFAMDDTQPLLISAIGFSWSLEEPYSWDSAIYE